MQCARLQQISLMIKQRVRKSSQSSSRKKVEAIYQQQQKVSQAFELNQFYNQQHQLNLSELKQRLNKFKKEHHKQTPKGYHHKTSSANSPIYQHQKQSIGKSKLSASRYRNDKQRTPNNKVNYVNILNNTSDQYSQRQAKEQMKMTAKWPSKQPVNQNPVFKTKTHFRATPKMINRGLLLNSLQEMEKASKRRTKTYANQTNSKVSQSSNQHSFEQCNFQGFLKVTSQGQVSQLQNRIQNLWAHYQLVTRILIGLRDGINKQRNSIVNYINTVCSNRFQFLKEIIQTLQKKCTSRSQTKFTKRLSRAIIQSRIFQNIGIIYVALYVCFKTKADSHLINCIGYATSSLTFQIRLLTLIHQVETEMNLTPATFRILQTIDQFQRKSYGTKILKVSDLILRLQQNNQVFSIVQNKILIRMEDQFQDTILNLLKFVDLDSKGLFEYSYYIFQFLAFHLCSIGIRGEFLPVEVPPAPYFTSFVKERTLVIEPWGVLFARKDKSTYIRAHSEFFLFEISKYWNIVYWSDLMPKDIDDLLQKLPKGRWLYRYHCIYTNKGYEKPLERIGCNVNNLMIIDRSQQNFLKHSSKGIIMPWKAQRRDIKLLQLFDLIKPILHNEVLLPKLSNNLCQNIYLQSAQKCQQEQFAKEKQSKQIFSIIFSHPTKNILPREFPVSDLLCFNYCLV